MNIEELEKEAEDNKPPYACCALDTKCELWKDGYLAGVKSREKQIEELEAKIEKMKCCSICKHYSMSFIPYWCTKNSTAPHCTSKCDKWEFEK